MIELIAPFVGGAALVLLGFVLMVGMGWGDYQPPRGKKAQK